MTIIEFLRSTNEIVPLTKYFMLKPINYTLNWVLLFVILSKVLRCKAKCVIQQFFFKTLKIFRFLRR